jgi:transcriptional regulator with PAS, ATPase and Fis domain
MPEDDPLASLPPPPASAPIVGRSAAFARVRELIDMVKDLDAPVLIAGESGTGKELVARAIHESGARRGGRFVAVNCGAIPDQLLESELFGYVRGAFTGALRDKAGLIEDAHKGTFFLDEIGDLSFPLQAKLLRLLQEKEVRRVGENRTRAVDVRFISATNKDLDREINQGRFREDLFYRLDVVTLRVPPLRERPQDVPLLARHFMDALAVHLGIPPLPFARDVLDALSAYPWPGNARELRNFIERSLILGAFPIDSLAEHDLAAEVERQPLGAGGELLADVEKRHILAVLEDAGGNKAEAARRLGISRKTLERKCALWGLRNTPGA